MALPGCKPAPDARAPDPRPAIVVVEGIISAGKTVLAHALGDALAARGRRVCVVPEPVDEWQRLGVLQRFYADPARWGYGFQTFVQVTRLRAIRAAVAAHPDADVFVLERSPASDAVFMALLAGVVDPVETAMYAEWCDAYAGLSPLDLRSATALFVAPSLGEAMRRLAARHRPGEIADGGAQTKPAADTTVGGATAGGAAATDATAGGGVSAAYQERLYRAHEAFLFGKHPGEFPAVAGRAPFAHVVTLEPALADLDFRTGAGRDRVVAAALERLGF